MSSLLILDDDILHLICAQLLETSPSSTLALTYVSSRLNAVATPYLYRNIVLDNDSDELIHILEGKNSKVLARHVRCLTLRDPLSVETLNTILKNCVNLRELRSELPHSDTHNELRLLTCSRCDPKYRALFKALADHAFSTKSLCFGFGNDSSVHDLQSILSSQESIQELNITSLQNHLDTLWPLVQKHKKSLKTLILRPTIGTWNHKYLKASILAEISQDFTNLDRLGFDIPFNRVPCSDEGNTGVGLPGLYIIIY